MRIASNCYKHLYRNNKRRMSNVKILYFSMSGNWISNIRDYQPSTQHYLWGYFRFSSSKKS
jgi:hypothetical protein